MKRLWLLVITSIVFSGCSSGTPVTITNRSAAPIEGVTVFGSSFNKQVGRVGPGQTLTVYVQATGECGLGIAFRSGSRHIKATPQGYLEGGGLYKVGVVVAPDLSTAVSSGLRY